MNKKAYPELVHNKIIDHPCALYESLNLNSINYPPLFYRLHLPMDVLESGVLSTLQIETVSRIVQSLIETHSFLLGDGTGTGKGRVLAATAWECLTVNPNIKVLWVSANKTLFKDAQRDTSAICDSNVLEWGAFGTQSLSYCSYSDLLNDNKLQLAVRWFGKSRGTPLLILDECHTLRHDSKLSSRLLSFTDSLTKDQGGDFKVNIVYSSATAASCPAHFRYATALNLWGDGSPFVDFNAFHVTLSRYGPSAMEMVALNLKASGKYVSRSLGFDDVEVIYEKCDLREEDIQLYDFCSEKLRLSGEIGGTTHQMFWQRFLASIKVRKVIDIIKRELGRGHAVIVALQNTGEASDRRQMCMKNPETVSSCHDLMSHVFRKSELNLMDPIDAIVNEFGADKVAEITGRQRRLTNIEGHSVYEQKPSSLKECRDFQAGMKRIAILSRAGSTGISLHAQGAHSLRRVHICMELPWSPEDFLQQCGRSHRSASISSPKYIFVHTDVPAELRFCSSVASRLGSMGALTKGDRFACTNLIREESAWNTYAKREMCIRICRDYLIRNFDVRVEKITETAARNFLEVNKSMSINKVFIVILDRLIECIEYHNDFDTNYKNTLLSCVETLVERTTCWAGGVWTSETIDAYPIELKDRISAFLFCCNHWKAKTTLGILPESVINMIVVQIAESDSLFDTSLLYDVLIRNGLRIQDIPCMLNTCIQNKLLGLEIKHQKMFQAAISHAVSFQQSKQRGAISVSDYVLNKTKFKNNLRIMLQLVCTQQDFLTIDVKVHPINLESVSALPFLNVVTGEMMAVDVQNDVALFYAPCSSFFFKKIAREQWDYDVNNGKYVRGDIYAWNSRCLQRVRMIQNKARSLSTRFVLVKGDALKYWEQSERILLRINEVFDYTFIALLYSKGK